MVSYESEFLQMWADPDLHLMYSEWLRLPTKEEYLTGVKLSEDYLHTYQVKNWIMDSTKLATMPIEDQRETLRHMAQVMVNSTLQKIARIVPQDNNIINFFEETLQEARSRTNSSIEIDRFYTFKAAADWVGMIGC